MAPSIPFANGRGVKGLFKDNKNRSSSSAIASSEQSPKDNHKLQRQMSDSRPHYYHHDPSNPPALPEHTAPPLPPKNILQTQDHANYARPESMLYDRKQKSTSRTTLNSELYALTSHDVISGSITSSGNSIYGGASKKDLKAPLLGSSGAGAAGAPGPPSILDNENSSSGSNASIYERSMEKENASVSATPTPTKVRTLKSAVLANQVKSLANKSKDLETMLQIKKSDYEKIQNNYYQHIKTIKATDDDESTIHTKLSQLDSKISPLPLILKKHAKDVPVAIDYFISRWPHLRSAINHLRSISVAREYAAVCLLVEKLVMEELVARVYNVPVHIGTPVNDAFRTIRAYMDPHEADWSARLLQQLCKVTAMSLANNDQTAGAIAKAKAELVTHITNELSHVYNAEFRTECEQRLSKIVDAACKLSLGMHSQDHIVHPMQLVEGQTRFDDTLMSMQSFSKEDASVVQLVICPPFISKGEGSNPLVLMMGKVICF